MSHLIPASLDEADSCLPLEVGRWYVVRTLPRQEARASTALVLMAAEVRRSIRTYIPLAKEWRHPSCPRNEGNKRTVPLMPGYLFAEMVSDHLPNVKGLEGVIDLIRTNGRPIHMSPPEVRKLHWLAYLESQGGTDYTWSAKPERWNPARGEKATVTAGHLAGFTGQITQLRGKNRMMVLGQWFGIVRELEVQVSNAELAA
ncbi:MAG TPA: transcription termination/antitermination NusG family protein [Phenylobacterium sp.]